MKSCLRVTEDFTPQRFGTDTRKLMVIGVGLADGGRERHIKFRSYSNLTENFSR